MKVVISRRTAVAETSKKKVKPVQNAVNNTFIDLLR
jgi:hypothetical protein